MQSVKEGKIIKACSFKDCNFQYFLSALVIYWIVTIIVHK